MYYFTYYESWNLAAFLLELIAGLALSFVIKSKGIAGFFKYLLSFIILGIIINGLLKGYSIFIENITFHLQQYIYYNTAGFLGFVTGFIIGLLFKRNK
jgi:hypothetical protein